MHLFNPSQYTRNAVKFDNPVDWNRVNNNSHDSVPPTPPPQIMSRTAHFQGDQQNPNFQNTYYHNTRMPNAQENPTRSNNRIQARENSLQHNNSPLRQDLLNSHNQSHVEPFIYTYPSQEPQNQTSRVKQHNTSTQMQNQHSIERQSSMTQPHFYANQQKTATQQQLPSNSPIQYLFNDYQRHFQMKADKQKDQPYNYQNHQPPSNNYGQGDQGSIVPKASYGNQLQPQRQSHQNLIRHDHLKPPSSQVILDSTEKYPFAYDAVNSYQINSQHPESHDSPIGHKPLNPEEDNTDLIQKYKQTLLQPTERKQQHYPSSLQETNHRMFNTIPENERQPSQVSLFNHQQHRSYPHLSPQIAEPQDKGHHHNHGHSHGHHHHGHQEYANNDQEHQDMQEHRSHNHPSEHHNHHHHEQTNQNGNGYQVPYDFHKSSKKQNEHKSVQHVYPPISEPTPFPKTSTNNIKQQKEHYFNTEKERTHHHHHHNNDHTHLRKPSNSHKHHDSENHSALSKWQGAPVLTESVKGGSKTQRKVESQTQTSFFKQNTIVTDSTQSDQTQTLLRLFDQMIQNQKHLQDHLIKIQEANRKEMKEISENLKTRIDEVRYQFGVFQPPPPATYYQQQPPLDMYQIQMRQQEQLDRLYYQFEKQLSENSEKHQRQMEAQLRKIQQDFANQLQHIQQMNDSGPNKKNQLKESIFRKYQEMLDQIKEDRDIQFKQNQLMKEELLQSLKEQQPYQQQQQQLKASVDTPTQRNHNHHHQNHHYENNHHQEKPDSKVKQHSNHSNHTNHYFEKPDSQVKHHSHYEKQESRTKPYEKPDSHIKHFEKPDSHIKYHNHSHQTLLEKPESQVKQHFSPQHAQFMQTVQSQTKMFKPHNEYDFNPGQTFGTRNGKWEQPKKSNIFEPINSKVTAFRSSHDSRLNRDTVLEKLRGKFPGVVDNIQYKRDDMGKMNGDLQQYKFCLYCYEIVVKTKFQAHQQSCKLIRKEPLCFDSQDVTCWNSIPPQQIDLSKLAKLKIGLDIDLKNRYDGSQQSFEMRLLGLMASHIIDLIIQHKPYHQDLVEIKNQFVKRNLPDFQDAKDILIQACKYSKPNTH